MDSMPLIARRLAGAIALVALVACSSMGTCWLRLATADHDCCEQGAAMAAPVNPCGATAASVASVEVAPPALSVSMRVQAPSATILSIPQSVPITFPVTGPPLVLRI
jgi:ACR3 family arsenite efflux pump ArsB